MKIINQAAERNKDPLLKELLELIPENSKVLELASGSGQHASYFLESMNVTWQCSDRDPEAIKSIKAYQENSSINFLDPIVLDSTLEWKIERQDFLICFNMIHISPWESTLGLFRNAELNSIPNIILYGPYYFKDIETAPSNLDFDQFLKNKNPQWGIRNFDEIKSVASNNNFSFEKRTLMPANNAFLLFKQQN